MPVVLAFCKDHSFQHLLVESGVPHTLTPARLGSMTGVEADRYVKLHQKADLLRRKCDDAKVDIASRVEEEYGKIDELCA